MKGLVLAGGTGRRLRPLTHTSAKQLLPVANTPILFYGIAQLVDAEVTDIGIVVGETGAEVRAAVGDGSRWGARITYIDQPEPLGLAHAVAVARPFLGDDDFVMYLGDNLLEEGVAGLVDAFRRARAEGAAARILLAHVEDPSRFGVAEIRDGRVVHIEEKPTEPRSDLAMVGAYAFTPAIHEAVDAIEPSARGELEIADAISWLIAHGQPVDHEVVSGWWLDTGKKDTVLEANRRVLGTLSPRVEGDVDAATTVEGVVVVEAGATVERSHLVGPVVIGAGSRIVDSRIGPHASIGQDVTVERTTMQDAVVLERASLLGVSNLVDSLVGRDTVVRADHRSPAALRLMIGDDCTVEVP
ncbi:MAG: glucose-1-phosphate thymidylyltransferase [Acidimicrobiales bacterium]